MSVRLVFNQPTQRKPENKHGATGRTADVFMLVTTKEIAAPYE
jgi:hypothetical protein